MLAPAYIQRELQLIDPMYFIVYNPYITDGINMSFDESGQYTTLSLIPPEAYEQFVESDKASEEGSWESKYL